MRKVRIPGFGIATVEATGSNVLSTGVIDCVEIILGEIILGSPQLPSLSLQLTPEHALELAQALRLEALVVLASEHEPGDSETFTCSAIAEGDGVEDGFRPVRCGAPAVVVDVEEDRGYCAEHAPAQVMRAVTL